MFKRKRMVKTEGDWNGLSTGENSTCGLHFPRAVCLVNVLCCQVVVRCNFLTSWSLNLILKKKAYLYLAKSVFFSEWAVTFTSIAPKPKSCKLYVFFLKKQIPTYPTGILPCYENILLTDTKLRRTLSCK